MNRGTRNIYIMYRWSKDAPQAYGVLRSMTRGLGFSILELVYPPFGFHREFEEKTVEIQHQDVWVEEQTISLHCLNQPGRHSGPHVQRRKFRWDKNTILRKRRHFRK